MKQLRADNRMQKIDKHEYQKRLDRMTEIFSGMIQHADELSANRCPYKNRFDQCTAKFGCRNQTLSPNPTVENLNHVTFFGTFT